MNRRTKQPNRPIHITLPHHLIESFDNVLTFKESRSKKIAMLMKNYLAREVINNPNVLMDSNGAISQIPARAILTPTTSAQMAQRECTKERQRLGLCEKPMKRKSTRKGQVRKTARRAYEK